MPRYARLCAGLLAAGLLVLILTPADAQDRPVKIVVVDLERVVAMSSAGKALHARLQQFQQEVQAEGEKKAAATRAIRKQITDGANSLSERKLNDLQKQYEDASIAVRRFQDDKQREGQKMQTEGLTAIEAQLKPVFETLRGEAGYDLILNNVPGVVVMATDRVDITKLVIERLDAAAK